MSENSKGKINRLASSGSPYLLQHANNPVDWHPWSEEAFAKAAEEDKPVFLSIGYSTCHWCHVMEKESFSDPEVAALMNEVFICVKVDREERPDVDHLYMTVCQLLTGSGGWPLTIVLTPDRKPFFAGTYFPRGDRHGRPGMLQLIPRIRELWTTERDTVNSSAEEIAEGLSVFLAPDPAAPPPQDLAENAYLLLKDQFDDLHGGFGSAPKFPVFSNLLFLLGYWDRTGEKQALEMVSKTIKAMRMGGIYDQIGYGLHRYSTDERWFAPHFEKMLYDQALAVLTCTDAFRMTGKDMFRQMADEILTYVLRDLRSSDGGFYSAEDADSEGEEGKFYTWPADELARLLDDEECKVVSEIYNITDGGNFLTETGKPTGWNILHLRGDIGELSASLDMDPGATEKILKNARGKLMEARSHRVRPLRDEKIMADWNGLMIAALARAASTFGEDRYAVAAEEAFTFVRKNLMGNSGDLLHLRYSDNDTVPAFLDDYAYLLWGLMELHQMNYRTEHLETAVELASAMLDQFHDPDNGGFFLTGSENDLLFPRVKPSFDGPMPSGNSVAAVNLIRLGRLTGRRDFEDAGLQTLEAFAAEMAGNPAGLTHMISALEMASHGTAEVIIAGDPETEDTKQMLRILQTSCSPSVSVLPVNPDRPDHAVFKLIPSAQEFTVMDGRATAYVCRNYACQAPTTDAEEMMKLLALKKTDGDEM